MANYPNGTDEPAFFGQSAVKAAEPVEPLPPAEEETTRVRRKFKVDLRGNGRGISLPLLVLLLAAGAIVSAASFWFTSAWVRQALTPDPNEVFAAGHAEGTAVPPPDEEPVVQSEPVPRRNFGDRRGYRPDSIHRNKDERKRLKELQKEREERQKERFEAMKEDRKRREEIFKEAPEHFKNGRPGN